MSYGRRVVKGILWLRLQDNNFCHQLNFPQKNVLNIFPVPTSCAPPLADLAPGCAVAVCAQCLCAWLPPGCLPPGSWLPPGPPSILYWPGPGEGARSSEGGGRRPRHEEP